MDPHHDSLTSPTVKKLCFGRHVICYNISALIRLRSDLAMVPSRDPFVVCLLFHRKRRRKLHIFSKAPTRVNVKVANESKRDAFKSTKVLLAAPTIIHRGWHSAKPAPRALVNFPPIGRPRLLWRLNTTLMLLK